MRTHPITSKLLWVHMLCQWWYDVLVGVSAL